MTTIFVVTDINGKLLYLALRCAACRGAHRIYWVTTPETLVALCVGGGGCLFFLREVPTMNRPYTSTMFRLSVWWSVVSINPLCAYAPYIVIRTTLATSPAFLTHQSMGTISVTKKKKKKNTDDLESFKSFMLSVWLKTYARFLPMNKQTAGDTVTNPLLRDGSLWWCSLAGTRVDGRVPRLIEYTSPGCRWANSVRHILSPLLYLKMLAVGGVPVFIYLPLSWCQMII